MDLMSVMVQAVNPSDKSVRKNNAMLTHVFDGLRAQII